MVGIIAAMNIELELIKSKLDNITEEKAGGIIFYRGFYKNSEVVCAVCGIGKVFAAMCAEAMIIKYKPSVIINTGVAGALSKDLKQLDCTVAEKCVQYDMDTSPLGDPVGMISGINRIYFEADKDYSDVLMSCYGKTKPVYCTIASGDAFVCDKDKKEYITKTFGASVCDMESAAIAHVCYVAETPFVISRVISDNADDNANLDFLTVCKKAADISSAATLKFINKCGGKK